VVLAPVPVSVGMPVCLYPDNPLSASHWSVFNFVGESVATLDFGVSAQDCWDTTGVAPGLYLVRIKATYLDDTVSISWHKVVVKP
jgi:hypothetical protein